MIFSVAESVGVRQGRITATLTMPSEGVQPRRVYPLRREVVTRDEGGEMLVDAKGRPVMTVEEVTDGGDTVVLTVLDVASIEVVDLDFTHAKACGLRTAAELRTGWIARHPRSPIACFVKFTPGDVRDQPRWMNWSGRKGGDYTSDRRRALDELEALSKGQLEELATGNRRKDAQRKADVQRLLALLPLAERLARVEALSQKHHVNVSTDLRALRQRITSVQAKQRAA